MKIKDMEQAMAAGTLVIVGKYGGKPATIIELRCTRKVYSGARWDFAGHNAHDGVKVRYEDGTEKVVGPREVIGPADEVNAQRDAARRRREEHEAALEAQRARCNAAVEALGAGSVRARYSSSHRSQLPRLLGYDIVLTPEAAEKIAEALRGR